MQAVPDPQRGAKDLWNRAALRPAGRKHTQHQQNTTTTDVWCVRVCVWGGGGNNDSSVKAETGIKKMDIKHRRQVKGQDFKPPQERKSLGKVIV